MISPEIIINSVIMGVLLGGLYGIMGLGLSMAFGVMKIVNLAHGDFVVFGSYLAFALLSSAGIDPVLSLLLIMPCTFILGLAIQKYMIERTYRIDPNAPLLITFSISIILQNLFIVIWTPYSRGIVTEYALLSISAGSFNIPLTYLLDFLVALVVTLFLRRFFKRTYLGLAIRASSQDWEAAQMMGVETGRVRAFSFGLALAISALSGVFVGLTLPFTPSSGVNYLLIAFGVLVIGGLEMHGSFIGGIVMGLTQVLTSIFIGTGWSLFFVFIVIFLALTLRTERALGGKR